MNTGAVGATAFKVIFGNTGYTNTPSTNMSELAAAAETVMVMDGGQKSTFGRSFMLSCYAPANNSLCAASSFPIAKDSNSGNDAIIPNNNATGIAVARHLETINVLWADGHVKAMKLDNLIKVGTGTVGTNQGLKYFTVADD